MDCTSVLLKEDIDFILEQLEIHPTERQNNDYSEYYNIWDFGKVPDETQSVQEISANLSLLI